MLLALTDRNFSGILYYYCRLFQYLNGSFITITSTSARTVYVFYYEVMYRHMENHNPLLLV